MADTAVPFSKYYSELEGEAKSRYEQKVRMIGLVDPYHFLENSGPSSSPSSSPLSVEWYEWPDIMYADIYNFLINTTSYCTHEQLKAYKSLEGYNFFVNGWVSNISVICKQATKAKVFILMALVKHSQRLTAPPLKVWVATKQQGEVLCAHCTCMAGLGEACSHIAALLFAVETNTQLKSQFSSTSLPCSWLPPSFRSVPFAEIANIDFTTPAQKRKQLLETNKSGTSAASTNTSTVSTNTSTVSSNISAVSTNTSTAGTSAANTSSTSVNTSTAGTSAANTFAASVNTSTVSTSGTNTPAASTCATDTFTGDNSASIDELPLAKKKKLVVSKPSEDEKDAFFKELSECRGKPVILSLIPCYSKSYVPLYETGKVMKPLTELFSTNISKLAYPDLLQKCEEVYETVSFSFTQAQQVEELTRLQADSRLWFQQRAGRITASKLRQVLHTDVSQPSLSLVLSICYPQSYKAMSSACQYGCEHEVVAREKYIELYSSIHEKFFVINSGLILHPSYPFLGATPDGIVNCSCCGPGVLEIKCPFRCKESSFEDAASQKSFCLEEENGDLMLKVEHAYYYQVQLQMKICHVEYADFVLWREEDMFVQRIAIDKEFIDDAINKTVPFIKLAILPELVGRWFTKQKTPDDQAPLQSDQAQDSWCYCKKSEDYGPMIGCDNDQCPIEWFHFSCLKMSPSEAPKGKWYCPECHKSKPKGKGKKLYS